MISTSSSTHERPSGPHAALVPLTTPSRHIMAADYRGTRATSRMPPDSPRLGTVSQQTRSTEERLVSLLLTLRNTTTGLSAEELIDSVPGYSSRSPATNPDSARRKSSGTRTRCASSASR